MPLYEVRLSRVAAEKISGLDEVPRGRVMEFLKHLEETATPLGQGRLWRIRGHFGYVAADVGGLRVLYHVDWEQRRIGVLDVIEEF